MEILENEDLHVHGQVVGQQGAHKKASLANTLHSLTAFQTSLCFRVAA
jgi:hypothetical protein